MTPSFVVLMTLLGFTIGSGFGYLMRWLNALSKKDTIEYEIQQKILRTRQEIEELILESKKKALHILDEADIKREKIELTLSERNKRIEKQEIEVESIRKGLNEKINELQKTEQRMIQTLTSFTKKRSELENALLQTTHLTKKQAQESLINLIKQEIDDDLHVRIAKLHKTSEEYFKGEVLRKLFTSLERIQSNVPRDIFISSIKIPDDESKGKIIGKEGRNIKAFEHASGVNIIIDETPGFISISSFNTMRREIAKIALESLLQDGKINPATIEESLSLAQKDIKKIIQAKGEEAVQQLGIYTFPPQIVEKIGTLYFKTSYGQNVLHHSIETAQIAGQLAEEMGAQKFIAQAGGLVHDIGKSIDHDARGNHVSAGIALLSQYNIDNEIITAMKSHHNDFPHESHEAILVQVADSLSASRPGARNDSTDSYVQRLSDLEDIAQSFHGVDKSFVISGGRELRIFVHPDDINDNEARDLARKIALKIEKQIKFGAEIKVHVIRESRIVEYAR